MSDAPSLPADACALTPRGLERQRRILCAAREVFLEQGFEKASISDIIARAGGSMSTLYRQFGNKVGLFEAMMQQNTRALFEERIDRTVWSDDTRSSLLSFGENCISIISKPQALAMYRIATGVNSADREQVQRIFYEQGPARLRRVLADYLEQQKRKGLIRVEDCEIAAAQFIEMLKAPWHLQAQLGVSYSPELPQRSLEQAVALFLAGVQPA